ncbi:MAG: hypothetical protein QOF89_5812 [Acidobacteriota bacterium]|jgi:hypothetical protein|nr:hypothetical protein [Acidobacteriota bacterium]
MAADDVVSTMMQAERSDLRKELQFLKECQSKYFSLTITATGIILGLAGRLPSEVGVSQTLIFLSPLLVVIPCWLVFFDKATTITRMASYVGVLEGLLLNLQKKLPAQYIGWETSISVFRKNQVKTSSISRLPLKLYGFLMGIRRLIFFRTTHRYWILNWYTFSGSAALCLWLSYPHRGQAMFLIWRISLVLCVAALIETLVVLGNLTDGIYSYAHVRNLWLEILKSRGASEALKELSTPGSHEFERSKPAANPGLNRTDTALSRGPSG